MLCIVIRDLRERPIAPAIEKSRSADPEVAGIPKNVFAIDASVGNRLAFSFQNRSGESDSLSNPSFKYGSV